MASNIEYAQLSARVYDASQTNRDPVPFGWTEIAWQADTDSGFSAGANQRGQHQLTF